VIESGGKKVLLLHGHRFDEFISCYPVITWLADRVYYLLQRLDQSHYFAKLAKRKSKTFLRCAAKIESDSVRYAAKKGCDAVCCGHTHHAAANTDGPVHYFNSGCWTEKPCHYLTLQDGVVEVRSYSGGVADESPVPGDAVPAVAEGASDTIGFVASIISQKNTPMR
jgi:UDP-2,3-diacylglucosamine pyrophosphatase LpxH